MRSVPFVAVILAFSAGGCTPAHLIEGYGDSYRKAFEVQRDPSKKPAEAISGLDSQEAAITADNYRATLAPKDKEVQPEPMVIVAPPSRERREPLAPSVPKE